MPQLVKKRRSGWAVLAAGALVASIFAVVGANPAAAEPRKADGVATWRACLGPASASNDFTDVAGDSVHLESINCLAYYGITTGKTDDTFDPQGNVTRSQMALFLARAADVAGIDLGDAMSMGFVDVNADDTERASAINRLVAKGIMFGDTATSFDPPSTTHFGPGESVTRWEMAMFLFAFLDYALDSVLIDQLPDALEGNSDGVGGIEHSDDDGDGIGVPVDDYFRDARRETPAHVDARIGAIYELGVTTGVNNDVGEAGQFDPNGLVTRAQMASFIMRSLNHTNLRPAGVTAQYVGDQTQVSVRGAAPDFEPVADQRVEVFYTHFENVAFDSAGECVTQYVGAYDQSPREACEIDRGDVETDDFGNALITNDRSVNNKLLIQCSTGSGGTGNDEAGTYALSIDEPSSIAVFKSWAWAGDLYDEVDSDTELFEVVKGNASDDVSPAPTHAVVTGGSDNHLKMGSTVEFEIQVSGVNPNASAANEPAYLAASPIPGGAYGFQVIVRTHRQSATDLTTVTDGDPTATPPTVDTWSSWSRYTEDFPFAITLDGTEDTRLPGVFVPNSDGKITVRFPVADPVRGGPMRDDRDVQIQLRVIPVGGNELSLVDNTKGTSIAAAGNGWVTGITSATTTAPAVLSSKASRVSDNDPHPAAVKVEPEQDLRVLSVTRQAYVSMTVTDQYGDPFTPWTADATNTREARRSGYTVGVNPASDRLADNSATNPTAVNRPVRARGKATHNYAYGGPGGDGNTNTPSVEVVTISANLISLTTDDIASADSTATVYWAGTGSVVDQRAPRRVYLADTGQRLIAVQEDTAGQPIVYEYGEEDRFIAEGRVVSFGQFEELITATALLAGPDGDNAAVADNATLEWDDYRRHGLSRRPSTDADWRLDALHCPSASS